MKMVTCTAPVNIAVIKYWGKRNEKLILPLNDSISFTLNQDEICAKTTVAASSNFMQDKFWLNGQEESLDNQRMQNCLKEIRRLASKRKHNESAGDILNWHIHICSSNNFPTAAGLASSAAGYACLVYALGQLYGVEGDLSSIARQGSGSACRSIYGGMVRWHMGIMDDGSDSIAQQIAGVDHFSNLRVIICVVNDSRKKTGSTEGMQRTVNTSKLMNHRLQKTVNARIDKILKAIEDKDWSSFCDLTIEDSNEMHACCLDTFPPCIYMTDASHAISSLVHRYNELKITKGEGSHKICYTFDAGPNACLFVPGAVVSEVMTLLLHTFPSTRLKRDEYIRGIRVEDVPLSHELISQVKEKISNVAHLKYLIHTRIGDGPRNTISQDSHLMNSSGFPMSQDSSYI